MSLNQSKNCFQLYQNQAEKLGSSTKNVVQTLSEISTESKSYFVSGCRNAVYSAANKKAPSWIVMMLEAHFFSLCIKHELIYGPRRYFLGHKYYT